LGAGHSAAATARVEIKMMKVLITHMSLMRTGLRQTVILRAMQSLLSSGGLWERRAFGAGSLPAVIDHPLTANPAGKK